jgi:hypothetical protein
LRRYWPLRLIGLAAAVVGGTTGTVSAQGFAVGDLREVEQAATRVLGQGFVARAAEKRLTFVCTDCAGAPMIDILLGRQTDGTEDRVRSGQTTVADLERLCRERNDACRLTGLSVAPAVGWISQYPLGEGAGSTAVIIRNGDLLTIRGVARQPGVAHASVKKLVDGLGRRIIGP